MLWNNRKKIIKTKWNTQSTRHDFRFGWRGDDRVSALLTSTYVWQANARRHFTLVFWLTQIITAPVCTTHRPIDSHCCGFHSLHISRSHFSTRWRNSTPTNRSFIYYLLESCDLYSGVRVFMRSLRCAVIDENRFDCICVFVSFSVCVSSCLHKSATETPFIHSTLWCMCVSGRVYVSVRDCVRKCIVRRRSDVDSWRALQCRHCHHIGRLCASDLLFVNRFELSFGWKIAFFLFIHFTGQISFEIISRSSHRSQSSFPTTSIG